MVPTQQHVLGGCGGQGSRRRRPGWRWYMRWVRQQTSEAGLILGWRAPLDPCSHRPDGSQGAPNSTHGNRRFLSFRAGHHKRPQQHRRPLPQPQLFGLHQQRLTRGPGMANLHVGHRELAMLVKSDERLLPAWNVAAALEAAAVVEIQRTDVLEVAVLPLPCVRRVELRVHCTPVC